MAIGGGSVQAGGIQRVVAFIDGGYLHKGIDELHNPGDIDFTQLRYQVVRLTAVSDHFYRPHLVRAYYYDADVDIRDSRERSKESEAKHDEIDQYLSRIKQEDFYQVRLGRLKSTKGRYKQKGVDVLLATDMVVKAYQGEYDTAVVLTGDDDLVDAIEAIKHIGKAVYGIFFEKHCSQTLRDSFDVKIPMPSKFDPKLFLRRPNP